jgi:hypothetical protein
VSIEEIEHLLNLFRSVIPNTKTEEILDEKLFQQFIGVVVPAWHNDSLVKQRIWELYSSDNGMEFGEALPWLSTIYRGDLAQKFECKLP